MPRGKRDVEQTRRIILKILQGVLFKQIAFEESVSEPRVSFVKKRYIQQKAELTLNEKGVKLLNEEQLTLAFSRDEIHRVTTRLKHYVRASRRRAKPSGYLPTTVKK